MSEIIAAPAVATLAKSDQNLVWLDCEMTGLDPEIERIIEIAVVVTGPDLQPRIEGPVFAIHQSDSQLDAMDAWNKGTHGRSGLIDRVKASTVTEAQAEDALIAFLAQYVPKGTAPLCGNRLCHPADSRPCPKLVGCLCRSPGPSRSRPCCWPDWA